MSPITAMENWQSSHLGREFLAYERRTAATDLDEITGTNAMQVGSWGGPSGILGDCRIRNKWIVDIDASGGTGFCSHPGQLAVAEDAVDLVVMPHTLERVPNPHHVLREAKRVLAGEGKLVLFGFNPWSTWGIPGWFGAGSYPWMEKFIGETRLRDWLALLEFEIIGAKRFFYRPPINNEKFLSRTQFVERIAARWLPIPPSAYMILARKKIIGVTPIPVNFKHSETLVNGIATPAARVLH